MREWGASPFSLDRGRPERHVSGEIVHGSVGVRLVSACGCRRAGLPPLVSGRNRLKLTEFRRFPPLLSQTHGVLLSWPRVPTRSGNPIRASDVSEVVEDL
jgi:hypothetical protein